MTSAGSWRTGFISPPLIGASGSILSKGDEVTSKNNKKNNKTIAEKKITYLNRLDWVSNLLTNSHSHIERNKIHKNIDPSWELQIDEIL